MAQTFVWPLGITGPCTALWVGDHYRASFPFAHVARHQTVCNFFCLLSSQELFCSKVSAIPGLRARITDGEVC